MLSLVAAGAVVKVERLGCLWAAISSHFREYESHADEAEHLSSGKGLAMMLGGEVGCGEKCAVLSIVIVKEDAALVS